MTARILIVDDDRAICELLNENLTERGYECAEAYDGLTALIDVAKEHYDAVLLDVGLPEVSGMEALPRIRNKHNDVAVIMITGYAEVGLAVEAMRLGASDFVVKPFDISSLVQKINIGIESVKQSLHTGKIICQMDAIAFGVEERIESIDGHAKLVTETTVNTARLMGVPETEINNWINKRTTQAQSRKSSIRISFEKLQKSPMAQILLGVSKPYSYEAQKEETKN